jgi:uncharacterized protein (TIGR02678 family)
MVGDYDAAVAAERRSAARLLVAIPLVTAASHAEEFPLVRRHAEWLAKQLNQFFGYRLVVEADFARLHKAGLGRNAGHVLRRASGAAFTPRCYAYLALSLSVLVTAPEQLLLSELVTRVQAAASEAGVDLGAPNRLSERRALVAALRRLVEWHVLDEDEGSLAAYADNEEAEALVTINREIARHMVNGAISRCADPDELIERAADPGRGGARHYVRRRLVETPVVYLDDLTARERAWLRHRQHREQQQFEELLGLVTEIRGEGTALVDPEDQLSDLEFPGSGTLAQAGLLVLERLVEALRPADAGHPATGGTLVIGVPIPDGVVERLLAELVEAHGSHWSQEYVDDQTLLRDHVLDLLGRMRLVSPVAPTRADGDTAEGPPDRHSTDVRGARGQGGAGASASWVLLAAVARYAPVVRTRREEHGDLARDKPNREQAVPPPAPLSPVACGNS